MNTYLQKIIKPTLLTFISVFVLFFISLFIYVFVFSQLWPIPAIEIAIGSAKFALVPSLIVSVIVLVVYTIRNKTR
jgi:hypothetical protein